MHTANTLNTTAPATRQCMAWVVCISASLFFFYEFIQGNMFASIGDDIMRDFHIKADTMAMMSSIYYVSNVIFLFLAGFVLDKFSPKKTILTAMMFCIAGTFVFANTHSFAVAMTCRFITGIGSAFCFLGPVRIASRWFPSQRMALVTGVIVTIAMTGGMIAQNPLTQLVIHYGWRQSLVYVGYLGIIIFILMQFGIVEKKDHHQSPKFSADFSIKDTYLNWVNLAPALYTSLMNMSIAVWGAMMGTAYLKQRLAIDADAASSINSLLFLGVIIGGPFIGWLSDKLALRLPPMKWGVVASLLITLLIMYAPVTPTIMGVLFFSLGFFTSTQVISYALVAESNSPAVTARVVSVISIFTQGGFILYQNLYSKILVLYGNEAVLNNGTPVYSVLGYQSANIIIIAGLLFAGLVTFGLTESFGRAKKSCTNA